MSDGSEFGIAVPKGDPGALRGAASTWDATAEALDRHAQTLQSTAATVVGADWSGDASRAYAGTSGTLGTGFLTGGMALRDAAGAARRFASDLHDAQQRARRALRKARDADDRLRQAKRAAASASGRLRNADSRAAVALRTMQHAAAAGPAGAATLSSAQLEHDRASAAAGLARGDLAAAERARDHAQHDLHAAQRDGREANEDADRAARAAAKVFSTAADAAQPPPVSPHPAVPVSLRGANPSLAGLNPALGGPFRAPGRYATPGQARAAQIARARAAAAWREYMAPRWALERQLAEQERDARNTDAGLIHDLTFGLISPKGDPNSDAYKRGQLLAMLPITPSGLGRDAVAVGGRVLVHDAEKKAAEKLATNLGRHDAAKAFQKTATSGTGALTRALERRGLVKLPGEATHHLVPKGNYVGRGAQAALHRAQAKLAKLGIGPDDAANGVFLDAKVHGPVHTNDYFRILEVRLRGANTREEAEDVLAEIARQLRAHGSLNP